MAYVKISNGSNAIPIFDSVYEAPHLKKIHPDVLIELPVNAEKFIKMLIIHLRYKYPGSGIYSKNFNSISFGSYDEMNFFNMSFMESIFTLQTMAYYDYNDRKCYIAFNTINVSMNDLIYFAEVIKIITGNEVYLNLHGKQFPHFDKLVSRYTPFILFKDYTPLELQYYGKRKYCNAFVESNVTVLISLLCKKFMTANDLTDIVEV